MGPPVRPGGPWLRLRRQPPPADGHGQAPAPPPDYANPGGPVAETTVPASKASIEVIAGLHAVVTTGGDGNRRANPERERGGGRPRANHPLPDGRGSPDGAANPERERGGTASHPLPDGRGSPGRLHQPAVHPGGASRGVFEDAYRPYRFRIAQSAACLICSAIPAAAAGEDLDVALDQALDRLGHE